MSQFGQLLIKQALAKGLQLHRSGDLAQAVQWLDAVPDTQLINASDRQEIADAFYDYAKVLLQKRALDQSLSYLRKSLEHDKNNQLVQERVRLLNQLIPRSTSVVDRLYLMEFATRLEIGGTRLRYFNEGDFLEYASDQGLIAPKQQTLLDLGCPCEVYFLEKYHPWQPGHKWTRAIRHFKYQKVPGIEDALAALVSDYLYKKTNVLQFADYIVPVPPDPAKYVGRGNFAPNDHLANLLSQLLAVPMATALLRHNVDISTREADVTQKLGMYELDNKHKKILKDRGILLLEDVATSGGTIVACLKRCVEVRPSSIHVVILGQTIGGV